MEIEERFWSKVDIKWLSDGRPDETACWEWTAAKTWHRAAARAS